MCKCAPKCYVDMDGVLTDFHSYFQVWLGCPIKFEYVRGDWNTVARYCEVMDITKSAFWKALSSEFWETMPYTKEAKVILEACEQTFGRENVCILSSPANAESAYGKTEWLKSQLPHYLRDGRVYLGRDKRFVACPMATLVDDGDHNIDGFRKFGGIGVLVPRFWNSAFALENDCANVTIAAIYKSWSTIEGRKKIIEKVDFHD